MIRAHICLVSIPCIHFFREVLVHQCLKAQFIVDRNTASTATWNSLGFDNFQHDFRTPGELCYFGFFSLNLIIYTAGRCVKWVFLKCLQDVRKLRVLGEWDEGNVILEQVYPLKKHLDRVCKYSAPGKPAWFLHLEGVECWDLSSIIPACCPGLHTSPWTKGTQLAVR